MGGVSKPKAFEMALVRDGNRRSPNDIGDGCSRGEILKKKGEKIELNIMTAKWLAAMEGYYIETRHDLVTKAKHTQITANFDSFKATNFIGLNKELISADLLSEFTETTRIILINKKGWLYLMEIHVGHLKVA